MAIDKEVIRGFSETANRHSTNQIPSVILQRMPFKFTGDFLNWKLQHLWNNVGVNNVSVSKGKGTVLGRN